MDKFIVFRDVIMMCPYMDKFAVFFTVKPAN
jgi:hypothetical protein